MKSDKSVSSAACVSHSPSLLWGRNILRDKSLELLRSGSLAPSVVMGNLLAASASDHLDADMLSSKPRPMSVEANRVISDALRRSRLPNANVGGILEELMEMAWTRKVVPAQRDAVKSTKRPPATVRRQTDKRTVESAKAPIIVRKAAKLSDGES